MHILAFVVFGGLIGMFGRRLMSGQGYGLVADTVLGILGGVVGGGLCTRIFGTAAVGLVISIAVAVIAAAVLVGIFHSMKGEPART